MSTIDCYGIKLTPHESPAHLWTPFAKELYAFKRAPQWMDDPLYTGQGRYGHLKQLVYTLWPKVFMWNTWSETLLEAMCENKWLTVTGPASSGKTTAAAVYALNFLMCDPQETGVLVCSTTLPGLRKRIWKEITHFYQRLPQKPETFNLVPSKTMLQASKRDKATNEGGDEVHGIFGVAVEEGNRDKALGRVIGFHPKRLLVIVDEMTDVSQAIVEACVNLESGTTEFQFIGLGNANSRFDPHGKMSEPKDGWNSITVNSEEWETNWGKCVHLDGLTSPNVIAGRDKYPGLLKEAEIQSTIRQYGEDSPHFWRMRRGFWPPDGIRNAIISEAMIATFNAMGTLTWQGEPALVAGLDPAYGGDRCVLKTGAFGKDNKGRMMIELRETHLIQLKADSGEPIHYQIARQTKDICTGLGIPPENLAVDASAGGGAADVLQREWSPRILRVDFGTRASDKPVSSENPRPSYEHYINRVSELWYQVRQFIESGQMRGLDTETATELCAREYGMAGPLIRVETKAEMKKRTGESPDLGDAVALLCEAARQKGVMSGSVGAGIEANQKDWQRVAKELDVDGRDDLYLAPEEFELTSWYG